MHPRGVFFIAVVACAQRDEVRGDTSGAAQLTQLVAWVSARSTAALQLAHASPAAAGDPALVFSNRVSGGMGNQLMGLANAVVLAACTRRRLLLITRDRGRPRGIGWLWDDYFVPPWSPWSWGESGSPFASKASVDIGALLASLRDGADASALLPDTTVEVSLHHDTLPRRLLADATGATYDSVLVALGSDGPARFPFATTVGHADRRYAALCADWIALASLSALGFEPRPRFAAALAASPLAAFARLGGPAADGPRATKAAVALQVRACVDCAFSMPAARVAHAATCALGRAKETLGPEAWSVSSAPLVLYATTESATAAEAIASAARAYAAEAALPLRVVLTAADRQSGEVALRHTAHRGGTKNDSFSELLAPVMDWYTLGAFELVFSCGTTFSQTAVARSAASVRAYHNHPHADAEGEGNATDCSDVTPIFGSHWAERVGHEAEARRALTVAAQAEEPTAPTAPLPPLVAFERAFAATQASDVYSNATFALAPWGLFSALNQVVQHLVAEHVVHGRRACFSAKPDWAYAPESAFESARSCSRLGCYLARDLACARRPRRAVNVSAAERRPDGGHAGPATITRAERVLSTRYPGLSLAQARAVVTRWLWRLPDHVEHAVSERALRVHALPPSVVSSGDWVAIHVRWGDKIVRESVKQPIERYLGLARALARRTSATRCVLLTTDAEAAAAVAESNANVSASMPCGVPHGDAGVASVATGFLTANRTRAENAIDVLSDVALMMRGRGAVMTISSNMAEFVHFHALAESALDNKMPFVLADADSNRVLNAADVPARRTGGRQKRADGRRLDEGRVCFTSPEDFAPGSLEGSWNTSATADYDAKGEWVDLSAEGATGGSRFGNLQCPLEPYFWSCGAGLGTPGFDWTIVGEEGLKVLDEGDFAKIYAVEEGEADEHLAETWREKWLELGRFAWSHRTWSARDCAMPPFEAGALAATLRGGRALRMVGDSTMRQLFVAVACLLPPALVLRYEPVWQNDAPHKMLRSGSRVVLRGGGEVRWIDGRLSTHGGGAEHATASGGGNNRTSVAEAEDIVVVGADLHTSPSRMASKIDRFRRKLEARRDAVIAGSEGGEPTNGEAQPPWTIYVQASIQHFGAAADLSSGCGAGSGDGTYSPEGYRNASRTRVCAACASPPAELAAAEAALSGLVAVVPNLPLRSAGGAHPLLFSPGDCSHFCQPGPTNALAVALARIISEYRNATEFDRRVLRSPFWRDRHRAVGG